MHFSYWPNECPSYFQPNDRPAADKDDHVSEGHGALLRLSTTVWLDKYQHHQPNQWLQPPEEKLLVFQDVNMSPASIS